MAAPRDPRDRLPLLLRRFANENEMSENMPVSKAPKCVAYFGALLDALRTLGGSAKPADVKEVIARTLQISQEEQAETLASGQPRFSNEVNGAMFYLCLGGYMDEPRHGVWALTKKGREAQLTLEDAFRIFKDRHAASRTRVVSSNGSTDGDDEETFPDSVQAKEEEDSLPDTSDLSNVAPVPDVALAAEVSDDRPGFNVRNLRRFLRVLRGDQASGDRPGSGVPQPRRDGGCGRSRRAGRGRRDRSAAASAGLVRGRQWFSATWPPAGEPPTETEPEAAQPHAAVAEPSAQMTEPNGDRVAQLRDELALSRDQLTELRKEIAVAAGTAFLLALSRDQLTELRKEVTTAAFALGHDLGWSRDQLTELRTELTQLRAFLMERRAEPRQELTELRAELAQLRTELVERAAAELHRFAQEAQDREQAREERFAERERVLEEALARQARQQPEEKGREPSGRWKARGLAALLRVLSATRRLLRIARNLTPTSHTPGNAGEDLIRLSALAVTKGRS